MPGGAFAPLDRAGAIWHHKTRLHRKDAMTATARFFRLLPSLALALLLAAAPGAAPALAQTADEIAAVQIWLNDQGYDAGPADGMMGSRTRNAISQWETEHGQPATGEVSGWIIEMALGGPAGAADGAGAGNDASGLISVEPAADSPVSDLQGDITAFSGTGDLEFSAMEDGAILISDGFPWRPGIPVASRTIEIVDIAYGIFTAAPGSSVPVPLDNNVVEVPGSSFVPLFLAYDRQAAATSSLADASGIVWLFDQGDLRFELDGYVLTAASPGATIAFGDDGVVLTGFELSPL